jgi:hypothetical protein
MHHPYISLNCSKHSTKHSEICRHHNMVITNHLSNNDLHNTQRVRCPSCSSMLFRPDSWTTEQFHKHVFIFANFSTSPFKWSTFNPFKYFHSTYYHYKYKHWCPLRNCFQVPEFWVHHEFSMPNFYFHLFMLGRPLFCSISYTNILIL